MRGFVTNIEQATLDGEDFRRVLFTAPSLQLVLMTLRPGEEIGEETHADHDQFIRVEKGTGRAMLDGEAHELEDGSAVVIPAGVRHNVINTSTDSSLKLYTLYSPPEHAVDAVHHTRADADAAEARH